MKKSSKFILHTIIYLFLFILYLIIINNSFLVAFFDKYICSFYVTIVGSISNIFSFSLFDILLMIFICNTIFLIFKIIKELIKKRLFYVFKNFQKLARLFLNILVIYCFFVSVLYYKAPINLPTYQDEITSIYISEALDYYIQDYNYLSKQFSRSKQNVSICPYDFKTLSKLMKQEMKRLDDNDYFFKYNATAKSTIYSPLLSQLHITGIDFLLTGEANINSSMPSIDIPFTIAHEMAHSKGIMREDDANLVALYICLTSSNSYIRYSGYFRGFYSLLNIKYYTNYQEYKYYVENLSQEILFDNKNYIDYFEEHDLLKNISKFVNDIYLKFNGQNQGVNSYNDITNIKDTNLVDEEGHPIYEIVEYSPFQKLMLELYKNS